MGYAPACSSTSRSCECSSMAGASWQLRLLACVSQAQARGCLGSFLNRNGNQGHLPCTFLANYTQEVQHSASTVPGPQAHALTMLVPTMISSLPSPLRSARVGLE